MSAKNNLEFALYFKTVLEEMGMLADGIPLKEPKALKIENGFDASVSLTYRIRVVPATADGVPIHSDPSGDDRIVVISYDKTNDEYPIVLLFFPFDKPYSAIQSKYTSQSHLQVASDTYNYLMGNPINLGGNRPAYKF